jgi:dTDP-glucose 4,6-dehydratase
VIAQLASGTTKIKLGAVSPTRDFSFIQDTVSGFIAALESSGALGEVVNLGSNFEISIGNTAQLIADIIGIELEIISDVERLRPINSEVERLWADNRKAKELFEWSPSYSGLDGFKRGLIETISWFRDPDNLKSYKADVYNV